MFVLLQEYTPEEQQELRNKLETYLEASTPEEEESAIQLESVRQMRELLKQMKLIYNDLNTNIQEQGRVRSVAEDERQEGKNSSSTEQQEGKESEKGVTEEGEAGGTLVEQTGISVGLADSDSRPVRQLAGPLKHSSKTAAQLHSKSRSPQTTSAGAAETSSNTQPPPESINMNDPNEAFKWYRGPSGPGCNLAQQLTTLKTQHRHAKAEAKEAAEAVNQQAESIKTLQKELKATAEEQAKAREETKESLADDTEYQKAAELANAKDEYKRRQKEFKEARQTADEIDESITAIHSQLLQEFDSWYEYHTGFSATGGLPRVASSPSSRSPREASALDTSLMFAGGNTAPAGHTSPLRAKSSVLSSAGSATLPPSGSPSHHRKSPTRSQDLTSTAANLASFGKFGKSSPGKQQQQQKSEDALDEGEAFEKMEMERIAADAPDSVAYYQAQKRMQSSMREAVSSGQPLHGRRRRQQLAGS